MYLLITSLLNFTLSLAISLNFILKSTLPRMKLSFNNLFNSNSYPEIALGNKTFESKYLLFKVLISISISNSSILKEADPNPVID